MCGTSRGPTSRAKKRAGIDAVLMPADDGPVDSLLDTDYILTVLSPRFEGAANGRALESLRAGVPPFGTGRPPKTVGLRVSTARLAPHLEWPNTVHLAGLEEGAARQELLACLGLGDGTLPFTSSLQTRFPGRQPEVVSLPMRDVRFVGRTHQLAELRQGFTFSAADHVAPRVLWGMKGAGKRQVALEYAHRFASQYDLVGWIRASTADEIRAGLRALARELNSVKVGARGGEDPAVLLADLRTGRYCSRWLLVFEGAPEARS